MFHLHRWSVRNRKPELPTYSEPSLGIHSLCSGFTDAFAMFSFDRDSTKYSVLCSGRGYSGMAISASTGIRLVRRETVAQLPVPQLLLKII